MKKSLRMPEVDAVMDIWEKDVIFKSTWLGTIAAKNPCDAWIYQELVHSVRPDFILETGTFKGGGALFLASLMDLCNIPDGVVYSIDKTKYSKPDHPRVHWITGNSVQADLVTMIHEKARGKKGMVILDSDHETSHVARELEAYADLVAVGSYLIVEDTWWRVDEGGPHAAVVEFLANNPGFVVDDHCDRYKFTNNPGGFLKRIA